MHLSPAALDAAIRLLELSSVRVSFGDILETAMPATDEVESLEQIKWGGRRGSNPKDAFFQVGDGARLLVPRV